MDAESGRLGAQGDGTNDDPLSGQPSAAAGIRPPRLDPATLPPAVLRELRASHMGETVAVSIYDGVVASGRDGAMTAFARSHRAVERAHLRLFDAMVPERHRSRLMPFWRAGGRLMGWVPARIHPAAFFAVIGAVETWVDGHYARQIALIRRDYPDPELLRLLAAVRADEATHSGHAHRLEQRLEDGWEGRTPAWVRPVATILSAIAVLSSRLGVAVGKWV